jgi:hypothetical protein
LGKKILKTKIMAKNPTCPVIKEGFAETLSDLNIREEKAHFA